MTNKLVHTAIVSKKTLYSIIFFFTLLITIPFMVQARPTPDNVTIRGNQLTMTYGTSDQILFVGDGHWNKDRLYSSKIIYRP